MNSQKNQIQATIHEIDRVLNQPSTSDSPAALKQILRKSQKILQQILDNQTQDVGSKVSPQVVSLNLSQENENPIQPSVENHPQQVEDLLAPLGHYLQKDLKIFQHQKQVLLEEIRQLEKQRQHNYSLAQQYAKQQQIIYEFSQALLGPLQETLVERLSQLINQYPSQIQTDLTSGEGHPPQSLKDIETTELMTISVDNLEDESNFDESFVDESNTEDSNNVLNKINPTDTQLIPEKKQQLESLPHKNDFKERIKGAVFPYPGYEFFHATNTESTYPEELTNQQGSRQDESNSNEQQQLEVLKAPNTDDNNRDLSLEKIRLSHIEAPSFEENNSEQQDDQNQTPKIEDTTVETDRNESPPENLSNFDETENIETAEIASLSHLFGELEINQAESEELSFPEQVTSHQTTVKQTKLKKDKYIQASPTENLLPVKDREEAKNTELLLDSNTLEQLRSDLEHLEEIDKNESILDDTGATKLQLGEYQPLDSAENIENLPNPDDNPFMAASEAEFTNLEDLFSSISENSDASHPEISSTDQQDMENEQILEDILDNLTSSTDDTETEIETDNPNFIELETLFQDIPNPEKKKLNQPETSTKNELSQLASLENLEPDYSESQTNVATSELDPKSTKIKPEINHFKSNQTASQWYLGIDFGTTGISAALLNRNSGKIYPLFWQRVGTKLELDMPTIEREFNLAQTSLQNDLIPDRKIYRLPSIVYLDGQRQLTNNAQEIIRDQAPLSLPDFKPALKISIPYVSIKFRREKLQEKPEDSFLLASNFGALTSHEPVLQWSEQDQIPLSIFKQGLVALLTTLDPQPNFDRSISFVERETQAIVMTDDYVCGAVGLDGPTLTSALAQLKGVIMGYPTSWPEAYRFNLREAVVEANLVTDANQVIMISDAIATAVSELTVVREDRQISRNSELRRGGILFINVGATTTELALINLPENMDNLTYSHFHCHSFAYGGHALDQDIVCQLLLQDENVATATQNQKQQSSQRWPQPGYPDLSIRYQLQQWLQSSSYRQGLLEAARNLKVILPYENKFTLNIGDRLWHLQQTDLETKVLEPFVKQLNRELNSFLSLVGISPVGINRAICTGGGGVWNAIARWLRQKLPNAIIAQDGRFDTINAELRPEFDRGSDRIPETKLITGRVAYGLATLPLYPQILDIPQQQYSDYFLLWEILRVFPDYPVSMKEIMQLLERRGINTYVCEERIKEILEGQLPLGLIPSGEDLMLLSEVSRQNSDYQDLTAKPLFNQEVDGRKYTLSHGQVEYVRQYLNKLVENSKQKLEEPLLRVC